MARETKSLGQKDSLDRFYTKDKVVQECLKLISLTDYEQIIEPSAGNGAFSKYIENCLSYDIAPAADNIIQADWLTLDKSQFATNSLVIGNPPFGQQNTLAITFFNEAAKFCRTIAFILPLSFKKDSIQNRLNLYFHLENELIIPENAFLLNGKDYGVPCVFQIWTRKTVARKKIKLATTSKWIEFVSANQADIRIPRVGGNAGKATMNLQGAITSNYFIKNHTKYNNNELVDFINTLIFPSIEFTVGPKSLSKGELISVFEDNYNE